MKLEVSQAVFVLKVARVAEAGFTDIDCRHASVRLAQRIGGSLRRPTAGDQDLSIGTRCFRRPQQQGLCPTPVRISIELAVPIEVGDRRRIRVAFIESAYLVGRSSVHWRCSPFTSHLRPLAPQTGTATEEL